MTGKRRGEACFELFSCFVFFAVCSVPSLKLYVFITTRAPSGWQVGALCGRKKQVLQSMVLVPSWLLKLNSVTVGTC